MLFPGNNTDFSCSDCLHSILEYLEKAYYGCNHTEKQAGSPSASNPLLLPSTICASISVHSQVTSEVKTQNQSLKCWQSEMRVQGRNGDIPGTSKLESSELTRQLLWADTCLGEPTEGVHSWKVPSTHLTGDKSSVLLLHYQSLNYHYTHKSLTYFLSNPWMPK